MRRPRLRQLLESFGPASETENLTGNITDVEALLASDALSRLDASHWGLYAFLVFDHEADPSIAAYIATDAPATDTGSKILLLFEGQPRARAKSQASEAPVSIGAPDPLVEFARSQFPGVFLVLPGLVFLDSLSAPKSAVYVPLNPPKNLTMVQRIRQVLGVFAQVAAELPDLTNFGEAAGVRLAKIDVPYVRNSALSSSEHVTLLLRRLWNIRKDLLAIIPVVGKLLPTADPDG